MVDVMNGVFVRVLEKVKLALQFSRQRHLNLDRKIDSKLIELICFAYLLFRG